MSCDEIIHCLNHLANGYLIDIRKPLVKGHSLLDLTITPALFDGKLIIPVIVHPKLVQRAALRGITVTLHAPNTKREIKRGELVEGSCVFRELSPLLIGSIAFV